MNKELIENLRSVKADMQKRLTALSEEAESTKLDIQGLDRMIARYEGSEQMPLGMESVADAMFDYDKMTLKEGVLHVLQRNAPRGLRARQIQNKLVAGGYYTTSENFNSAIFAMLSHLVKKGKVKSRCRFIYGKGHN